MEQFQEYWPQYLTSNAIAILVLFFAWKKPKAARVSFGVIFLAASIVNAYVAVKNPSDYLNYGKFAFLELYRRFIDGWFAENTRIFVLSIAVGQLFIGMSMFAKGSLLKPAIVGIVVFGLAIAPLGIGSAFPCSILLAIAGIVLWKHSADVHPDDDSSG